jgi:N6-adenosine-specific RNA methylase IME4
VGLVTLPAGPFDVIVVDPPWSYGSTNDRSSAGKHYRTLQASTRGKNTRPAVEELVAIAPVHEVAADAAALYLWITNPKMRLGMDLLDVWGFDYKTILTWVKVTKDGKPRVGMGFFYRGCTEHVLVGTRGGYAIAPDLRPANVVHAERGQHSAKPDEFYRMVEQTSPGQQRLDVFARRPRLGWQAWGDEVPAPTIGRSEKEEG